MLLGEEYVVEKAKIILDSSHDLPQHGFKRPLDWFSSTFPSNTQIHPMRVNPDVHQEEANTNIEQSKNRFCR